MRLSKRFWLPSGTLNTTGHQRGGKTSTSVRRAAMTVNEFIECATALGWSVRWQQCQYAGFPFCTSMVVNATCLSETARDGRVINHVLYETFPNRTYKKRYLTEVRKHNAKVFARLPEAGEKGFDGFVNVMRYCT
jgi:hypothetical protein